MSKINILGINISTERKQEIIKKIFDFLNSKTPHYVVTPNPEFLLAAHKNEEFFYILNQADIAVPDGIGLVFAGLFLGRIIRRISGIDLMLDVCALAEKENKSIFLLGGLDGVAKEATEKLKLKFPKLKIVGAEEGLKPGSWKLRSGKWLKGKIQNKQLEVRINEVRPDILFVAFGHPRQEKWIYHSMFSHSSGFNSPYKQENSNGFTQNTTSSSPPPLRRGTGGGEDLNLNARNRIMEYHPRKLNTVSLVMGVGGSFDFIAGRIQRAPKLMRTCGLEWLWRLTQEPKKRWPRIYDAVIKFPWEFFKWRFVRPWQYRPNVACLLYKRVNGKIQVLLAERNHPVGHWQLPQGGTDGEDLITAGSRELREEIGTRKFKPIANFKNLHRYKFGNNYGGRAGVKSSQILGYKGQRQGLFIAEFIGQDSDITINFWDHRAWRWVDLEKVAGEVHPYRKEAAKIFMEKFKTIL